MEFLTAFPALLVAGCDALSRIAHLKSHSLPMTLDANFSVLCCSPILLHLSAICYEQYYCYSNLHPRCPSPGFAFYLYLYLMWQRNMGRQLGT